MKRFAFAAGVLALGLVAAAPARADFAVVRFETGYCQIWWDSTDIPWGAGWAKIAFGLPDYWVARTVLDNAIAQRACLH